jgi:lactobin A/cerein 7B family class IIb bacteriocin
MQELKFDQVEDVNGGIAPLVVAAWALGIDTGLLIVMGAAYLGMGAKK